MRAYKSIGYLLDDYPRLRYFFSDACGRVAVRRGGVFHWYSFDTTAGGWVQSGSSRTRGAGTVKSCFPTRGKGSR